MKRLLAALSAVGVVAVSTTGCIPQKADDIPPASTTGPAPTHDAKLAKFYSQKLTWGPCQTSEDTACAKLTVPVDYAKPDGETLQLAVLKHPSPSKRKRGALIVNPGGPGGSGVQYAEQAAWAFPAELLRAYDVIGFDPRGVAASKPILCQDGPQFDAFLGTDPTPDDKSEENALVDGDKAFGAACQSRNGELLAHVSTEDAARDIDVLRAAVGDQKLNYFGASYGTFLGATYADLFPKNVGRMVLDGAIDPKLDAEGLIAGQAGGFEKAFNAFLESCVHDGSCPLGGSVEEAQGRVRAMLKDVDQHPLDARGAGPKGGLNESWASYGIAAALYDQGRWATLEKALSAAIDDHNGGPLMLLATEYTDRNENGTYNGNMLQVINAVNCLDRSAPSDPAHYEELQKQYSAKWPTFGPFMAWSGLICGVWPVKATGHAHAIKAPGSAPIVVVGTTRDPATPYEGAVSLADQLENGILVSRDGDGHTGYNKGNACVDKAVSGYLIRDQIPAKKTTC